MAMIPRLPRHCAIALTSLAVAFAIGHPEDVHAQARGNPQGKAQGTTQSSTQSKAQGTSTRGAARPGGAAAASSRVTPLPNLLKALDASEPAARTAAARDLVRRGAALSLAEKQQVRDRIVELLPLEDWRPMRVRLYHVLATLGPDLVAPVASMPLSEVQEADAAPGTFDQEYAGYIAPVHGALLALQQLPGVAGDSALAVTTGYLARVRSLAGDHSVTYAMNTLISYGPRVLPVLSDTAAEGALYTVTSSDRWPALSTAMGDVALRAAEQWAAEPIPVRPARASDRASGRASGRAYEEHRRRLEAYSGRRVLARAILTANGARGMRGLVAFGRTQPTAALREQDRQIADVGLPDLCEALPAIADHGRGVTGMAEVLTPLLESPECSQQVRSTLRALRQ